MPPLVEFVPALGPAGAAGRARLAAAAAAGGRRATVELHLAAWALFGRLIAAVRPLPFPLQFMVGRRAAAC